VGLVDKLGTGVYEFINEPRKGLLKGPKEFRAGLNKGMTSLVQNVVGGSFDSVSKLTGSLYGVLKSVSGQEIDPNIKPPQSGIEGFAQGIKGGGQELVFGFTGIFTTPYSKARQDGAKGFVKGLGQGLVGAVASPFTATMRFGNNVSTGIKKAATSYGQGELLEYGRYRHPRFFNARNVIEPYNEEFAQAYQILRSVRYGEFATSTIRFFAEFEAPPSSKGPGIGMLIITQTHILFVDSQSLVHYESLLGKVEKCEVFSFYKEEALEEMRRSISIVQRKTLEEVPLEEKYSITISNKKNEVLQLDGNCYPVMDKIYSIINV